MKRRRVWLILAAVAVLVLAFAATLKATNRSEYAFLAALGPTQVFDAERYLVRPPGAPPLRFETYYFDRETSPKALAAMKKELTAATGFTAKDMSSGKIVYASFLKSGGSTPHGAMYANVDVLGLSIDAKKGAPQLPPGGAVVIVVREPTWFEQRWEGVKKFLHVP